MGMPLKNYIIYHFTLEVAAFKRVNLSCKSDDFFLLRHFLSVQRPIFPFRIKISIFSTWYLRRCLTQPTLTHFIDYLSRREIPRTPQQSIKAIKNKYLTAP
uniref:Uncharacterized protein n=1 Tax=Lepeophtheirus salmonis TaxID=72036 RepID=A0A0K2URH1_LEPSM